MIEFAVEPLFPSLASEMQPLIEAHHADVGHRAPGSDQPCWTLNPDWKRYQTLEDAGMLLACTVREDGRLIGYYVNVILQLPHYAHVKAAISDVFFVHPAHRRSGVGIKMFKFMEQEVKKVGVETIKVHCKVYHDLEPMLDALGYYPIERIFSKHIGG